MIKILCLPILFLLLFNQLSFAQPDIFSKNYIELIIEKVNHYQYTHPWKETDDNWIRGTYYTGVMACYQSTGEKMLLEQCDAWGEKLNWQIPALKPGQKASGANLLTCGQTWLESYLVKKKKYKIEPIISHLENPEIRNPVSNPLYWYFEGGRRYVDGLFTGPPALAMLYKITGNEKYLHWMDACFWDVYGTLYDLEEGLFYRDTRYIKGYRGAVDKNNQRPDSVKFEEARRSYVYQETKQGEKVIWARGNGWAFAGIARILKYLPKGNANYERYKTVFLRMAVELKKRQQPDGFWYPNLADEKDYGTRESSCTGFFNYGLAWGINNGILEKEEYLPVIEKSWAGLVSGVSDEGKVQWGQLVGSGPYKILKEDSHEYVTGTFLLAASEMYKIVE
jgi:unsaturated rhamnogalacturonyl hydrolase